MTSAISLDRLLEPGASVSVAKPPVHDSESTIKSVDCHPESNILISNMSSNPSAGKKCHWTQISPALYATPEVTPLPDSFPSFPPSPFIVNHKRRGIRLLKSPSMDSDRLKTNGETLDKTEIVGNEIDEKNRFIASSKSLPASFVENECIEEDDLINIIDAPHVNSQSTVFSDPQESLISASYSDGEGNIERSLNINTPLSEFFDAWEELSDCGSHHGMESEMRELKLSILVEIEKRKQAEGALLTIESQWRKIIEHLSNAGELFLPQDLSLFGDEVGDELRQQLYVSRFVWEHLCGEIVKDEVEIEMEGWMEAKKFEISRLSDRVHYYETMNREMCQRNQENLEILRRERQRKRRRQKWLFWGGVGAVVSICTGVLAWSYAAGECSITSNGNDDTNRVAVM